MAEKFLMPKLSPTMEEGQISRWLKNEGDSFEAGETLAEVDTDKATMEMTALSDGTLLKIIKAGGDTAALGEAIAITGKKGEDISALPAEVSANGSAKKEEVKEVQEPKPAAETPAKASASSPASAPVSVSAQPSAAPTSASGNGRLIVSPIAARMAADNGVDLRSIAGSGPNGRIIKRDIEEALAGGQNTRSEGQRTFTASTVVGASPFRDATASRMRQVIASRLAESIGPSPTFYLT